MTAVLTNTDINAFHEKLMIYNRNFFSVINVAEGLLGETTTIKDTASLGIPTTSANSYSIEQFSKFIKKVLNFNIKNYTETLTDTDLCFVNKDSSGNFTSNNNNRDHLIKTLKVVSVFVDILEAYKYCIDNANAGTFDTGFTSDIVIDRIELVSDKTRFYSGASNATMTPSANDRNVGYIRKVTVAGVDKTVLYLSIQSFDTGMGDPRYNYEDLFSKSGAAILAAKTNILHTDAIYKTSHASAYMNDYKYQRYSDTENATPISRTDLTSLDVRNRSLVVLLIRTLFGLDTTFRIQSVNALYYYYKFAQLYTTLIIHVSNVMYNDVKRTSGEETSRFRIETYNMTTNKNTHVISGFEKFFITGTATEVSTYSVAPATGDTPTTPATITSEDAASLAAGTFNINRGKGYKQNPVITASPGTKQSARATIVPVVYADTTTTNNNNIIRLEGVITEINATITVLLDELSQYSETSSFTITTPSSDATKTKVYATSDKYVVINITKPSIYTSLITYKDKFDLVNEFVIYDVINKYTYEIIDITDVGTNEFEIKINAVFDVDDKARSPNSLIFKNATNVAITPKPMSKANATNITNASEYLVIKLKETNTYKTKYITTKDDVSRLETDIAYRSSKVTHQNNLYESQNNKKIFLERQVLAYNIILAIIVIILVAVNVGKVDKGVVKTVSLSCFGAIILLFVIYFISNMTYIETFASVGDPLYELTFASFTTDSSSTESLYTPKKIKALNGEITKLNTRFLGYFEKLIITLPASDNYDFYKEISEIITNDKENKEFIRNNLDYSKNQNDNNINSIKYELENNKLYINTLLISAVIFVGLYNLYINYMSEKYLYLLIFISFIIFVVILSYYYITANRRVKTVFKNIYWGPEHSKRF